MYCPVHLIERNWLVHGSFDHMIKINGEAFFFYDEESKNEFVKNYPRYL